jgi:hypothetical protein
VDFISAHFGYLFVHSERTAWHFIEGHPYLSRTRQSGF